MYMSQEVRVDLKIKFLIKLSDMFDNACPLDWNRIFVTYGAVVWWNTKLSEIHN